MASPNTVIKEALKGAETELADLKKKQERTAARIKELEEAVEQYKKLTGEGK